MTTFTIFYGAEKPIKAVGKNQCKLLCFAEKYRGWHSYNIKCRPTHRALEALEKKGYLEVNQETFQFRFKYPDNLKADVREYRPNFEAVEQPPGG